MCYAAQVSAAHANYLRMTGAQMDFEQFEEIFGLRNEDPAVRIARAVDRWFEDPGTAPERRIRKLIDQYRTAQVTKLETEVFAQKRRLADAERKLAEKPTKAAAESQRIATDKIEKAIKRLPLYKGWQPTKLDDRIFPLHYAPIVINDNGSNVLRLARYHLRRPTDPPTIDRKYPGLYNARRDNLEKFWKGQFGAAHALMLVESFFENVDRGGKNAVLHFTPQPASTMLIACLYAQWTGPKGEKLLSFAAITDEPPPEVAAAGHDRMIVSIKPENVERWLTPQGRSNEELQAILGDKQEPFYEHEVMAA